MAKNAIQEGDILALDPGATVASGAVAELGSPVGPFLGVSLDSGVSGTVSAFGTYGVYDIAKTTGTPWTVGQAIYFKASTVKGITLASGNMRLGICVEAAASGATSGKVRVFQAIASPAGSSVILEGQSATAAGASKVITVGADYNGKVVLVWMLTSDANVSVRSAAVAASSLTVTLSGSATAKFLYQITSTDVT